MRLDLLGMPAARGSCEACPSAWQAQTEAEAEQTAEEAEPSGAVSRESRADGGDHAGGNDDRQDAPEEDEEALLQQSATSGNSAPQGLERWRGKVALVTGPRRVLQLRMVLAQSSSWVHGPLQTNVSSTVQAVGGRDKRWRRCYLSTERDLCQIAIGVAVHTLTRIQAHLRALVGPCVRRWRRRGCGWWRWRGVGSGWSSCSRRWSLPASPLRTSCPLSATSPKCARHRLLRLAPASRVIAAFGKPHIQRVMAVLRTNRYQHMQLQAQEAEVVALPRIIVKRWPDAGVDILINNAGLGRNNASLWEGSTASWVEMISINVLGVCMCTREAIQVRGSWLRNVLLDCKGFSDAL